MAAYNACVVRLLDMLTEDTGLGHDNAKEPGNYFLTDALRELYLVVYPSDV